MNSECSILQKDDVDRCFVCDAKLPEDVGRFCPNCGSCVSCG